MKKLISSVLMTLDGFAAGPDGELNMFNVDEAFFDLNNQLTEQADVALYGRKTYEIMQAYWPTAAHKPDASKHDIEHAAWYNKVNKVVISTTLKNADVNTKIIGKNIPEEINKLKQGSDKNIQIFGSPTIVRLLMQHNLIDEYWIFVAPVVIGNGISLFNGFKGRTDLKFLSKINSASGIVGLHYEKIV